MITLPQPQDTRWAIFGRHPTQDFFIERLAAAGCPAPLVITSPAKSYERDRRLLIPHCLFGRLDELAAAGKATVAEIEDVNHRDCRELLLKHRCNAGFSTACRNIIKRDLIDFFGGRLYNLHGAWLPNERGAALNTWRILNNKLSVGCTIHLVDEGIDSGTILFRHMVPLTHSFPRPLDYDRAMHQAAAVVMENFLDSAAGGRPIEPIEQDETTSIYLPRLYTEQNGAIDFGWPIEMIERFVRAFSDPYPGAFTFLGAEKVHIHDARIIDAGGFHPFANGKVVSVLRDGSVSIIAGGGVIRVQEVTFKGIRESAARALRTRHTLITPRSVLEQAQAFVPSIAGIC